MKNFMEFHWNIRVEEIMEQKVLYYSDELNDELAPATIQSRVIDEKFKYKKGLIWNACSLFIQNVLSMPIKWG